MMNDDVAKAFPRALANEVQSLTAAQGKILMSIWPLIFQSVKYGYGLIDQDRRGQVVLTGSVGDMCASGVAVCSRTDDETVRVARMNFQGAHDLLSLVRTTDPQPKQWSEIGAACGYAELRAELILSGLYGVLEEGHANFESAQQVRAARETGGAKRGHQMTQVADQWKAKVISYVVEQDRAHPKWTRDQMAIDVLFQFEGDVPGHKAVTDWLKNEVEQPNGPIRSRARKKSA